MTNEPPWYFTSGHFYVCKTNQKLDPVTELVVRASLVLSSYAVMNEDSKYIQLYPNLSLCMVWMCPHDRDKDHMYTGSSGKCV